ncbi:hypothetical protein [Bacillus sp. SJS]|uniref:hypothetical protein n=1 Tax=Bacillus sp. SJS TaxID=1423321 RepID=UPI0004DD27B2|nr:hypothetical protein [Bacillus sp. SJS]KZZ85641.1 hypothetical protein AS29_003370 [Bacillus sp. SJS]
MNIYEALEQLPNEKKLYFSWKHDIRFKRDLPKKSAEDFMREVNRKSLDGFVKWERTAQYKNLLMLLLESKIADDFDEIYKITVNKAKEGDEKSIRLFLTLQKDIQANAKMAAKTFNSVEDEIEEDDGLMLD